MTKPKKKRLKKSFKIFLFILILLCVGVVMAILNQYRVINIDSYWQNTKVFFKSTISSNTLKNSLESSAVENDNLDSFSALFKVRLPSQNMKYASSSEISVNGDMKIYLEGTENNSGYLYVNTKDNPDYVWITFVSIIDVNPLKDELKNDFYKLDYIDLRFSNKVFYKFKNNLMNVSSTSESKSDTPYFNSDTTTTSSTSTTTNPTSTTYSHDSIQVTSESSQD